MDLDRLKKLVTQVAESSLSVDEAVEQLKNLPYENLGFARVDNHRTLRQGVPETILCTGKTGEQVALIAESLLKHHSAVLATRAEEPHVAAVSPKFPFAKHHMPARILTIAHATQGSSPDQKSSSGQSSSPGQPSSSDQNISSSSDQASAFKAIVLTAGTADLPVAEECAVILEHFGVVVNRIYDVGVAGVHRLLDARDQLDEGDAIVVCAGMDGVLPSLVGGLVAQPVIAVPTSIGYGANFEGLAPLLTMLNSCAQGLTVVNIDNGFGAAMAVLRMRVTTNARCRELVSHKSE